MFWKRVWVLGGLLVAGCGGRTLSVEPKTENVTFQPEVGTACYGAMGPFWITLTDDSDEGAARVAKISLARTGTSWETTVDGTGSEVEFLRPVAGTPQVFTAIRGTVSHTLSAEKVTPPRSKLGSLGSVSGHIDLVLVDTEDPSHQVHVSTDYVAALITQG